MKDATKIIITAIITLLLSWFGSSFKQPVIVPPQVVQDTVLIDSLLNELYLCQSTTPDTVYQIKYRTKIITKVVRDSIEYYKLDTVTRNFDYHQFYDSNRVAVTTNVKTQGNLIIDFDQKVYVAREQYTKRDTVTKYIYQKCDTIKMPDLPQPVIEARDFNIGLGVTGDVHDKINMYPSIGLQYKQYQIDATFRKDQITTDWYWEFGGKYFLFSPRTKK